MEFTAHGHIVKSDWHCQHSGKGHENPAIVTRRSLSENVALARLVTHAVTFKLKVVEDKAAAMEYRVKEKHASERLETRTDYSAAYNPGNTVNKIIPGRFSPFFAAWNRDYGGNRY